MHAYEIYILGFYFRNFQECSCQRMGGGMLHFSTACIILRDSTSSFFIILPFSPLLLQRLQMAIVQAVLMMITLLDDDKNIAQ